MHSDQLSACRRRRRPRPRRRAVLRTRANVQTPAASVALCVRPTQRWGRRCLASAVNARRSCRDLHALTSDGRTISVSSSMRISFIIIISSSSSSSRRQSRSAATVS